jgi:hypothetical protein
MQRLRAIAVGLTLVLAAAWPALGATEPACAAEGPDAGLVIDTGSRVLELCVALDAASVSGTHLIELASTQYGLSYAFGFGDQAVCMLAGVGVSGGDCFEDYPDFWGYWHADQRGHWGWSSTSPASYRVSDGMLEGWVWGPGDSGSTHGQPPRLTSADVCSPDPSPTPSPPQDTTASESSGPGGATGGSGQAAGTSGTNPLATSGSTAASGSPPKTSTPTAASGHGGGDSTHSSAASSATTPTTGAAGNPDLRASGLTEGSHGGPPAGLYAAVALATILGIAGGLRLRSARMTGRDR